MSKSVKKQPAVKQPSILNWMGTLLLTAIPGVNLIFLILSSIFAKSRAKRSFSLAGLFLIIIVLLLTCAAFAVFPGFFTRLADTLRKMPARP